jgi:putative two-component system response regulator
MIMNSTDKKLPALRSVPVVARINSSVDRTPLNNTALRTLQAVQAWEHFEQRLSDDDRALLDRISMGDCIKSASNRVGMTYANAQRRLLRLQERMGVRSLPLLIWVWRTVTRPDQQSAEEETPMLVEHAHDIARFMNATPKPFDALRNQRMSSDELITLLESRIRDGDSDSEAMSQFIVSVSMSLPSLLWSNKQDFAMAVRAAKVIAGMENPQPLPTALHILLEVGSAHTARGISLCGVTFIQRAITLALDSDSDSRAELRRAYSVYSAMCVYIGQPSSGVEYALRAAALANDLNQDVFVAAAMTNMTGALCSMGMYQETMSIGLQAMRRFDSSADCSTCTGVTRGNVAAAALAIKNFSFAARLTRQAITMIDPSCDEHNVLNRVAIEGTLLKALIGLGQKDAALASLNVICDLAKSFNNPRIHLNMQLAQCAYEARFGNLAMTAKKLLALKERTNDMTTLYCDNLALLIDIYERSNEKLGALQCTTELVDFLAISHVNKVCALVEMMGEETQPVSRSKHSVRTIVEEIESDQPRARLANRDLSEAAYRETFERLAISAELRDDVDTVQLGRHAYRVGALARLLALRCGCDDQFAEALEMNARLHDIGKLAIPENIVRKTDTLTEAEIAAIRKHASVGAQILSQCRHPAFRLAEDIAHCHHEKWDGSGYPRGLKADAIPLAARIVAVADVYDTLMHARPHKDAWSHKDAVAEIKRLSSTHFDPKLVALFVPMVNQLRKQFPGDAFDERLSRAGNDSSFLQARDRIQEMLRETEALLS